jgi:4-hydroxy-3-polyprenylbenzoate decarboxylase
MSRAMTIKKIAVGVTGATGAVYAVRLLEELARRSDVEVHLVISQWGAKTLALETGLRPADLAALAHRTYDNGDLGAPIASGSFGVEATAVVPCSVKTLAGIASGYASTLIGRAADVALKERRPLILAVRETPLSAIHLRNMLTVCEAGGTILPPLPAFYGKPSSLDDIITHTVGQILRHLGLETDVGFRWEGAGPVADGQA